MTAYEHLKDEVHNSPPVADKTPQVFIVQPGDVVGSDLEHNWRIQLPSQSKRGYGDMGECK
jgi:hypothetical protein